MGVVLHIIMLLFVIGFVVAAQGSEGSIISPSPAFLPAVQPNGEAPDGLIHNGQTSRSSASSPSDPDGSVISPSPSTLPTDPSPSKAPSLLHPNGSFLQLPVALPPSTSGPTPQKIKGIESSISPSPSPNTKSLSPPPYKSVLAPSTAEMNFPPSLQPIPPQRKTPIVRPPISTPTASAPVAIPPGNFPKTSPISQPIKHGSVPPEVDKRNESKSHNLQPVSPGFLLHPPVALPPPTSAPIPQKIKGNESSVSPSPSTISLSPPYKAVPEPSTVERNFPPSVQPIPPQKTIPIVTPPISTPTAPAPVAITPGNVPKTSPISQPIEHGNLPPNVDRRNESKSHNLEPVSPGSFLHTPVALPPPTSAPIPQKIKGNESSISPSPSPSTKSLSPPYKAVPEPSTAERNFPPSMQPIPPQKEIPIVRPPISTPTAPAPVAIPPGNFPKTSPISQPIKHGSVPPEVDKRNESKSHNLQPVSPGFLLHPPVALPPPTSAPIPQKIKGNESSVSPSPSTISLSPPYKAVPEPSTVERNFPPSVQPIPPQKTIPIVTPPISTPTAPAPVAITPGNVPKTSPISQPIEHGNLPPNVDRRNESKSHNLEPVSPGSFLHTPVALPPPTSAPIPQKIKGNESSISPSPSPSTKSLSPPYKAVPEPSTAERNFPPSMQPIPPQKEIPIVRPPISTPTAPAPVAIPPGNFPKTSPISQPIKHGSVPPEVDKRNESKSHNLQPVSPGFLLHPPVALPPPTSAPIPQKIKGNESSVSPSPSTISLSPPYKAVPEPSTVERNFPPSVQPIPPQKTIPIVTPPISTPTAPAPVAITPGNVPKTSPISQPIEHGNLPPNVDRRNESKSHNLEPVSPGSFLHTPVALPPPTSAPIPQKIKGNESSISPSPSPSTKSLSPPYKAVPEPSTAERNFPPSMQPIPPQKEIPIVRPPISTPTAPAPVAIPPGNFPKTSPISQPIKHGSVPPEVDKRNESKSHNLQPVSPGFLLHPPVALPPPTSAPIPQKIKGNESSVSPSPSTISLSPPYKAVPEPSTVERNFPPSVQPIPPQKTIPIVTPPISTPTAPAPVAITPGNVPKTSPISQPIEHGNLPPNVDRRNESKSHNLEPVSPGSFLHTPVALPPPTSAPIPQKIKGNESSISPSPSPSTKSLSPPYKAVPEPSTAERNFPPSMQPIPPQKEIPIVRPPISTPTAPAPLTIPPGNLPRTSPISQPIEHGSLPPKVGRRNESRNHNLEPLSPAPVATPSTNEPKISPISHSTNNGSLPPNAHSNGTNTNKPHLPEPISPAPALNLPKYSPVSQPTEPGSLPPTVHRRNSSIRHTLEPVSQAPVAEPPKKFPKNSPVNQPTRLGSFPPNVHNRTVHKGHTPEPVMPPPSTFPADPPLAHPVIPAASPHELPAPAMSPSLTPSRRFNGKNGGEPVSAPLYKTPKSPPAIVHSPAQAPSVHKARPLHHAPEPLISPPKSPFNKDHSPASSPSTAFYKHHHTRNTITNPAPASSYIVSPPTSKHQGSADSPFTFPIQSPASQVSPAPSPSFVTFPHSTKIPFHPPEESPLRPFLRNPKKPIQALPPPPPNEDCLSFICSEPLTNSPPGVPCMCVWPMRVGLRLSVPLYTFFPLVSELASEIATGVFMKPSQVRIMGANTATDLPDKTDALIDLVPLVEEFDNTTAFIASERFWHKQVAIKNSYFGDYEVLYVSYPGLPPSPPLPPSSVNMIDGGPYSNNGNNGRTIKPLGVDIQKKQHKSGLSKGIIAIIALSAFLAIVLCSAAVFALSKFRGRVPESQPTSTPRAFPPSLVKAPGTAGPSVASASTSFRSSIAAYAGSAKTFSMNEIEKATDNFHPSRILGEGGFGLVYSGNLEDGSKVAFKVLKREDHHGDREFLSEVEMLSRLHHRNLVKLIGICTELSFRCLVYELIPNGSVESHLHGVDREKSPLDWSTRIKIALGAARGLAYLHEDSSPHVIHRDFKSSNILLENDFTPKVSDFGLARTAADEDNRHISTRVMGTFGYVAPEYAMTGHLLVKSDVYSYGVVLLELLTGRKPVDFSQPPGQENLVAWARPLLTSREGLEALIDPSLGTNIPFDSVAKVAAIASMCVQPEVSDRPFMGEVVQALKLVCNECDEAKEAGSTNSSQEELSSDFITASEQQPDSFRGHFAAANYDYGVDIENGLAASELFSSSARFGRQVSGSFRRHSYSGPLRTGRSKQLWQIIRNLSGGSVSEHGVMFK